MDTMSGEQGPIFGQYFAGQTFRAVWSVLKLSNSNNFQVISTPKQRANSREYSTRAPAYITLNKCKEYY